MADRKQIGPATSLVIGGTGLVGGFIVEQLVRRGERPFALSRKEGSGSDNVQWFRGDLEKPETLKFPEFSTLYCTADAVLLSKRLPQLLNLRRFGFMPLIGGGPGLRQPVHAEDLATAAIAAGDRPAAINKFYALPGPDTVTYREMIGRIFDGMRIPRRMVHVPPLLWRAGFVLVKPLFPGANVAMGLRMMKDMTFDATPAKKDLGWNPRAFRPDFAGVAP